MFWGREVSYGTRIEIERAGADVDLEGQCCLWWLILC